MCHRAYVMSQTKIPFRVTACMSGDRSHNVPVLLSALQAQVKWWLIPHQMNQARLCVYNSINLVVALPLRKHHIYSFFGPCFKPNMKHCLFIWTLHHFGPFWGDVRKDFWVCTKICMWYYVLMCVWTSMQIFHWLWHQSFNLKFSTTLESCWAVVSYCNL